MHNPRVAMKAVTSNRFLGLKSAVHFKAATSGVSAREKLIQGVFDKSINELGVRLSHKPLHIRLNVLLSQFTHFPSTLTEKKTRQICQRF
ncbi:hypothetical protein ABN16_07090 [Levilactobacillus koreensis]|uniref:Uncharacterized protein n=1 Tax=Levilactobacillus koreensis TaxID=637971 RepID=A0AAC9ER31_9LACO|nr:hypothetical protein ABN16_07090 [Levilactobacillus koreensis]